MSVVSSSVVVHRWTYAALCLLLSACATTTEINDSFARLQGLERLDYHFSLPVMIYQTVGVAGQHWHVYIEGDGRPWQQENMIAKDPTSTRPLMLQLMEKDTAPSIYLGRPCYNMKSTENSCHPYFWTHGRFSEAVVNSLASTLQALVVRNQISELTLIGHSGGGTLAMLLAERIEQSSSVVTLAGNLDINAWADHHGYSRLHGSLNPANREPLSESIMQYHFLGENDSIITADMISPVIQKQNNTELVLIRNYDHDCCWYSGWSDMLEKM